MKDFQYIRSPSISSATAAATQSHSRFLAGGTTQIDLMKCGVENPERLIDITFLQGMNDILVTDSVIHIGALAKMSHVADNAQIKKTAPALSESLWRAASAQLRNMATIGGNLMQRTRCSYFRDPAAYSACNKRMPGSGCAAMQGNNRNHAILGTSEHCIAIYPGDFAVALMAFDAVVTLQNAQGNTRKISIDDFFLLPENRPDIEHNLQPGEMILAVEIPVTPALQKSHYLKVRDRASYEFAAASAAVGIEFESDGKTIRDVRIAMGGVATKPWRVSNVEQALKGQLLNEAMLRTTSMLVTEGAHAREHNGFKITLAPKVITRAILSAGEIS